MSIIATTFVTLVFASFAFVSFVITENAVSFGFLSVPGVSIVVNLWKSRKRKPSDSE